MSGTGQSYFGLTCFFFVGAQKRGIQRSMLNPSFGCKTCVVDLLRVRYTPHFPNDSHFNLPRILHFFFNFLGDIERHVRGLVI